MPDIKGTEDLGHLNHLSEETWQAYLKARAAAKNGPHIRTQ